ELSPWTLSGTASAQADRPRTTHRKATREGRTKALSAGQCDESASCRAAGAVVTLAPFSTRTRLIPGTNKTKGRAPRSSPPTGALPRPTYCHIRRADAQARLVGARY